MKKMVKKLLLLLSVVLVSTSVIAKPLEKVERGINKRTFVPKGQWIAGGTVSYHQYTADDFKFVMLNNISGQAYNVNGRLMAAYTFADDIAAGVSFSYDRSKVDISSLDINLSEDMNFEIKDSYTIQHVFHGSAFLRTYLNLGNTGRFGLFNDVRISFGGGQGKIIDGKGGAMTGTYEKIQKVGLYIAPGLSVFVTDFLAIEAQVNLLGVSYTRTEQITNQVSSGSWEAISADFKTNLLSIGLGLSFFF